MNDYKIKCEKDKKKYLGKMQEMIDFVNSKHTMKMEEEMRQIKENKKM